ncbi:MAG: transcription-repair coupling factor [Bdellovibrionales bacterium GWB1_55_8]|nr:MAG: transcription-repair coupling factor [Bdellovibrionales bacterium GWB1_55_8]
MTAGRIEEILRSVRQSRGRVRVQSALQPARALLAARFARETGSPVLVICPTDDVVTEFAADVDALSTGLEGGALPGVIQLPAWEQSPYSPIAPSIRTRLARARLLALAASGNLPRIIISSLPALFQATIPKQVFADSRIRVLVETSIGSREQLVTRLLNAGYLRVDPVEDPGTFAVRGEIIDVYPPDRDSPVRIELFGDEVEQLREFDPASQRAATTKLASIDLYPAREVLINSSTAPLVRDRLKARADDVGISRAIRDPIMSTVHAGIYPDHSDAWASFAYEKPETALNHLPDDLHVLWNDELECEAQWTSYLEEQRARALEAPESRVIAPAPQELFLFDGNQRDTLRVRTSLFLDQLTLSSGPDLTTEPKTHYRLEIEGNSDLARGSRQSLGDLESRLRTFISEKFKVLVLASSQGQIERIKFLLEERRIRCQMGGVPAAGFVTLAQGALSSGFRWPAEGLIVLTDDEVLGSRHARNARGSSVPSERSESAAKDWAGLSALSDLSIGDAVVHVDHGVGRYLGLSRLDLSGAPSDFLQIEYANKDKLYLPVYRLNVVQKYVGGQNVALDRLGSQQFAKAKEKVKDAVRKLAVDLVQLYAERKIRPGVRFSPRDSSFREFEAKFPFEETPDQLRSVNDILKDLESGRVMDRLVCGDVGYGKTEVAIRAAFRAVSDGKQVAVLVPTTVLAFQHEQSFKERLKDFPIRVDSISRFKGRNEQLRLLGELAAGRIDILIGTHRLLSADVKFRDLGLLIVDEEHRFGVEHKEKLKAMKVNTHVLTLTATPIPRTLHMALSGLRDISLIRTPPVDRLPIRTYVSRFDEGLIRTAIEQELKRGGQVFYLHNRVQSIHSAASKIRELVPDARIGVAHGQLSEKDLEKEMLAFYKKESNVLVCTTIIESGLDLPSANTIIIERADTLGLAQLYQIRGRVGRGQERAYAYLLVPETGTLTADAKQRLEVIQRFVDLGSGFNIANHDLEIRGGGDLLGAQQSGHIDAVGFELYTELLEEAIHDIQGRPAEELLEREPEIKIPFPAFLDESYVPDVHQRLALYRRFSAARNDAEIDHLENELADRFGGLPAEAKNLLWLIRIKLLLKSTGIEALTLGPQKLSLQPGSRSRLDPTRAIALMASQPMNYQLTPDSRFVATMKVDSIRDLFFGLEGLVARLINDSATPGPR